MTAILCYAKDCTDVANVANAHPYGGTAYFCGRHANLIKEEQDAVILRWLRVN